MEKWWLNISDTFWYTKRIFNKDFKLYLFQNISIKIIEKNHMFTDFDYDWTQASVKFNKHYDI